MRTFGNGARIGTTHCQGEFKPIRRGRQADSIWNTSHPGGACDYPDSSCRSASRLFSTPFHADTDLGFRVVLATRHNEFITKPNHDHSVFSKPRRRALSSINALNALMSNS